MGIFRNIGMVFGGVPGMVVGKMMDENLERKPYQTKENELYKYKPREISYQLWLKENLIYPYTYCRFHRLRSLNNRSKLYN